MNSPCIVQRSDGRYVCSNNGIVFSENAIPPIHCICPDTATAKNVSMPSLPKQAWNLATSLAAFVADGCKLVTAEEYAARLAVCDSCEFRRKTRCLKCGCRLALKAKGRAFKCPEDKWPVPTGTPNPPEVLT